MNVVILSTYPAEVPRHGGQHRLANIAQEYRRAGHQVRSVGVLGANHYPPASGFLPLPSADILGRYLENTFLMEDWAIGQWATRPDGGFNPLAALIGSDVDLLHVEQPWLFEFARRHAASLRPRKVTLVYGSQNVEHRLKESIVASYMGEKHARRCADLVLASELAALAGADLVCAVSSHDVDWCLNHTRVPVILAPNGVAERSATNDDFASANKVTGHRKFALYCASAHPPNVVGFYDMLGEGIGFLAPNERLVVAGSAGGAILGIPRAGRAAGLQRHVIAAGELDEGPLSALLQLAHAMVLPITQGGGTNLKTAEALWSGHHIVATSKAMRGFESFATARGVSVTDDPAQFRAAIRDAMARPPLELNAEERQARRCVLWSSCLQGLVSQAGQAPS